MNDDIQYSASRDGKFVTVPPIDELCLILKDKFLRQDEYNKRLAEENKKLKSDVWQIEEVARLKKENERLTHEWLQGFPISDDEIKAINAWKASHPSMGYEYKFVPTALGTSGTIYDGRGNSFEFCEI